MQLINILFLIVIIILAKILRKDLPLEKKYLYLMIFTLPWINDRGFGPIEFGFTIYPHYIFAFCFISVYLIKRLKRKEFIFYRTPLDVFLALGIFVTILSLWQIRYTIPSPLITYCQASAIFNKTVYLKGITQTGALAYMAAIYWFVVNSIENKKDLIACLKVLLASALIFASVSLGVFLLCFG